jgi:hypothetical protein
MNILFSKMAAVLFEIVRLHPRLMIHAAVPEFVNIARNPHLTDSSIYLWRCTTGDSGIEIYQFRVFTAETSRSCFSSLLGRAVFALLPHLCLLGFIVFHSSLNRILRKHAAVELYWWKRQVLCNLTEKQSSKVNYSNGEFASKTLLVPSTTSTALRQTTATAVQVENKQNDLSYF